MYRHKMKNYNQKDVISLHKNNLSNVKLSYLLIERKEDFKSIDLGIVQNLVMTSRSRAILRCTWIKHNASQTVIF
jgi:hypothetical protein